MTKLRQANITNKAQDFTYHPPPSFYEPIHNPPRGHNYQLINAFSVERRDDDQVNIKDFHSTSNQYKKRTNNVLTQYSRLRLDSNENMTSVGVRCPSHIIEHVHGKTFTVHPVHDSYNPKKDVKVCNATFTFDQSDDRTLILIVSQCLNFSNNMKYSLLCKKKVRSNGIIVEDTPIVIDMTK